MADFLRESVKLYSAYKNHNLKGELPNEQTFREDLKEGLIGLLARLRDDGADTKELRAIANVIERDLDGYLERLDSEITLAANRLQSEHGVASDNIFKVAASNCTATKFANILSTRGLASTATAIANSSLSGRVGQLAWASGFTGPTTHTEKYAELIVSAIWAKSPTVTSPRMSMLSKGRSR